MKKLLNTLTRKVNKTFKSGALTIIFLLIAYQGALFIHKAAVMELLSKDLENEKDTVFVVKEEQIKKLLHEHEDNAYSPQKTGKGLAKKEEKRNIPTGKEIIINKVAKEKKALKRMQGKLKKREYLCFNFDPNNASLEELQKLGFSEKQAQAIVNYRNKGGKFRRKSDFAKSFVVSDSIYKRLEPYIQIALLDLNTADSTALRSLPGIGAYFANKILSYRSELGGAYSFVEQLLDIPKFGAERFEKIRDMLKIDSSTIKAYPLWTLDENELKKHPYISSGAAKSIVFFRKNNPKAKWTIENLKNNGILKEEHTNKLSKCKIAKP